MRFDCLEDLVANKTFSVAQKTVLLTDDRVSKILHADALLERLYHTTEKEYGRSPSDDESSHSQIFRERLDSIANQRQELAKLLSETQSQDDSEMILKNLLEEENSE
jgi:hypothetical protein